ncbi:MAG: hypothetical protein JHD28_01475 [Bacteroidia bacterium]|nr:hypothetical protein [Bacteroidia bacterium]
MKILNQTVGMNTKTFSILLFAILLINACGKDCPDSKPIEKGVDKSYLPYIIPYSDTSTRLFLKNGTDTLVFKSQGLKETKTVRSAGGESCDKYNLQQLSLKMAASDTDFFEVNYYARWQGDPMVNFEVVNSKEVIKTDVYQYFYDYFKIYINSKPINKTIILNTTYDSVNILKPYSNLTIYTKPNVGIIKIETSNSTYELIK